MLGLGIGLAAISTIGSIATGIWGASNAKKEEQKAAENEERARREMQRLKNVYASLDTSNPYLNMENKMEDLTVNQQQAQFQAQQFQQSQANILDNLRGAAGGSGVAALAQQLAQQGQLASQQASASIGQQESANQMAERKEASRLDTLERQGVSESRAAEKEKYTTLLGMSQEETAAYRNQRLQMQQMRQESVSNIFSGVMDMGSTIMGGLS